VRRRLPAPVAVYPGRQAPSRITPSLRSSRCRKTGAPVVCRRARVAPATWVPCPGAGRSVRPAQQLIAATTVLRPTARAARGTVGWQRFPQGAAHLIDQLPQPGERSTWQWPAAR